jgi:hypothetical protein
MRTKPKHTAAVPPSGDKPEAPEGDEYLWIAEAAEALGYKGNTFSVMRSRGQLPKEDRSYFGRPLWLRSTLAAWRAEVEEAGHLPPPQD